MFRILANEGKGVLRYLHLSRAVKDRFKVDPVSDAGSPRNFFSSGWKDRRRSLTRREDLYSRFSEFQILMLSDVLRHLMTRMEAGRVEVVFSYPGKQDAIEVTPMGQYYFARRLLLKEMQDLSRSSLFAETPFGYDEVVTAALETGLVNGAMLDEVSHIEELWNPRVSSWLKASTLALRISGSSCVFLPPPFNLIGALAIVVIEGVVDNRHQDRGQGRDGYDPF
jgi:hypothetical protein